MRSRVCDRNSLIPGGGTHLPDARQVPPEPTQVHWTTQDEIGMSYQGSTKSRIAKGLAAGPMLAWRAALCLLLSACAASAAFAQREPVHYFHSSQLPPGTIGPSQLLRGGPLAGYLQPLEIRGPEGLEVSVAIQGQFEPPQKTPALFGMFIGPVYRLKLTRIPRNEGQEVFPTIEVINRLYPPPGLENHFPIPVHFTQEELTMALSGRLVTRVIYLEDPQSALPVRDSLDQQRYYEVRSDEDPLKTADRLGRPMAIMRMGSRTPEYDSQHQRFLFDCPPLQPLAAPAPLPGLRDGLEEILPPVPRIERGRSRP